MPHKEKSTTETKMNPKKQVYMQNKGMNGGKKKANKNGMYNSKRSMSNGY